MCHWLAYVGGVVNFLTRFWNSREQKGSARENSDVTPTDANAEEVLVAGFERREVGTVTLLCAAAGIVSLNTTLITTTDVLTGCNEFKAATVAFLWCTILSLASRLQ